MKPTDAPPTPPPRGAQGAKGARTARRPSPAEQALVERFRSVLASGDTSASEQSAADEAGLAEGAAEDQPGISERQRHAPDLRPRSDSGVDADPLNETALTVGMLSGPTPSAAAVSAAAQGGGAAAAAHPAAVAQLLEKHVRQLLVSSGDGLRAENPEVLLNLTDAALPGTRIRLAQTESGWRLESQSSQSGSYRLIRELAPELKSRFAERGLGELEIDVRLVGDESERSG